MNGIECSKQISMNKKESIHRGTTVELMHNGRIKFGICAETELLGRVIKIDTPEGIIESWHILSYGWGGWLPEEIARIWEKHNVIPQTFDELD